MLGVATDVDVPCGEVVCGGLWICMPRNIPPELMWFATKPMFLANSKSYEFCITCDNQHQSVIWICAIEVSRIEYCYGIGMLQLKPSVSDVESIVLNFYLVWFSLVWLFVCCSISLPLSLSYPPPHSFILTLARSFRANAHNYQFWMWGRMGEKVWGAHLNVRQLLQQQNNRIASNNNKWNNNHNK